MRSLRGPHPAPDSGSTQHVFLRYLPALTSAPRTLAQCYIDLIAGDTVATSFNQRFNQHGAWRREFSLRLKLLGDWMREHDLLDAALEERLHRLETQVRADRVMVAFVAEFSRGKSELINAIFFAGYGRRIMPASAGRTTMCPTELGYEADVPPCLRLLPIETRLQPQALMEWRMVPEKWTRIDLDVNDAAQLAGAMEKVSETVQVSRDEARALGFWHDEAGADNPMVNAEGMIEIPKWRHALINMAHPLLKQGLVVLDTPGLNAIGAEPELTVSLIPQAQAAVFILAADTGVTKSDLAIWREHLATQSDDDASRLVVLNKIDTMWDGLLSREQVQLQIDRQRSTSAEILGVPLSQVIPVSAQKGLLAKVSGDKALLQASQLPLLEQALGQGLLGQRQRILHSAVMAGVGELQSEAGRVIMVRRRDLAEQLQELKSLHGKNSAVIRQMRLRIEQENGEFGGSGARIHAVRSVHLKLLKELFRLLGTRSLKAELSELNQALRQSGLKFGVKKAYGKAFDSLRAVLQRTQALNDEIQAMLGGTFQQLNTEFGFSLQVPKMPDISRHIHDLEGVERGHLQYLALGNTIRLAQPEFSDRLVRALATRVRSIFETVQSEIEMWNKSAMSQMDVQLRERRRNFERRLEAVQRIQQAAGGLDDRIAEIRLQEGALTQLDERLDELIAQFIREPAPDLAVEPADALAS